MYIFLVDIHTRLDYYDLPFKCSSNFFLEHTLMYLTSFVQARCLVPSKHNTLKRDLSLGLALP